MVSKLSKKKIKGQRSVLKLIKDREVTDVNSEDNNSDIYSEDELNSESATRAINITPGHKRKERSPQESINNPYKKINMGDSTEEKKNWKNNWQKKKSRKLKVQVLNWLKLPKSYSEEMNTDSQKYRMTYLPY